LKKFHIRGDSMNNSEGEGEGEGEGAEELI